MLIRLATLSLLILWLGGCNKQAGDEDNQDNTKPSTGATPNGTATPSGTSREKNVDDEYYTGEEIDIGSLAQAATFTLVNCAQGGTAPDLYLYDTTGALKKFSVSFSAPKGTAVRLFVSGEVSDDCEIHRNGKLMTKIKPVVSDVNLAMGLVVLSAADNKLNINVQRDVDAQHKAELRISNDGGTTWHEVSVSDWVGGNVVASDIAWQNATHIYHMAIRVQDDEHVWWSLQDTAISALANSVDDVTVGKYFSITGMSAGAKKLRVYESCDLDILRHNGNRMDMLQKTSDLSATPDDNGNIGGMYVIGIPLAGCKIILSVDGAFASTSITDTKPPSFSNAQIWVQQQNQKIALGCRDTPLWVSTSSIHDVWASGDGGKNWTKHNGSIPWMLKCLDKNVQGSFEFPVDWNSEVGQNRIIIRFVDNHNRFYWWLHVQK